MPCFGSDFPEQCEQYEESESIIEGERKCKTCNMPCFGSDIEYSEFCQILSIMTKFNHILEEHNQKTKESWKKIQNLILLKEKENAK